MSFETFLQKRGARFFVQTTAKVSESNTSKTADEKCLDISLNQVVRNRVRNILKHQPLKYDYI